MARSLTVTQEEEPSTSPLLTGFLLFAAFVLVLGTLAASWDATAEANASSTAGAQVD